MHQEWDWVSFLCKIGDQWLISVNTFDLKQEQIHIRKGIDGDCDDIPKMA